MSWLLDTSVLIGAIQTGSARHTPAKRAVAALLAQNEVVCVVPQNLVEFWAVATRPMDSNGLGLSINESQNEIDQIKQQFLLRDENETIFENWESLVGKYSVIGKTTHDARLVAAMQTHRIESILTFNVDDFKRYSAIINVSAPRDILPVSDEE